MDFLASNGQHRVQNASVYFLIVDKARSLLLNPGRFGHLVRSFPILSGRFGLGRFGSISEVSHFGPVWTGRFHPISKVGHFGPILGARRFGLIYEFWESS